METLRTGEMPDLVTVLDGVNGSGVIPALQQAARSHRSGWVLDRTTVPEEIVGGLGPLTEHVRVGNTVYIDHAGGIIVAKPAPVGENT